MRLIQDYEIETWFRDTRIDGMPAHKIVRIGIVQIPEGRRVFAPMSVLDNLKTGAYTRKDIVNVNQDIENIYEHFPILNPLWPVLGRFLGYGGNKSAKRFWKKIKPKP